MPGRFTLRGPAWLHDSAAFGRAYQDVLRADLPALAGELKADAALAYSGTRFAATFQVASTFSPGGITLTQGHPLFPYVENPTRAHPIAPRTPGGVLAWTNASGAHFARHVQHPGTKGRQAIPPILAHYAPQFRALLIAAVQAGATRG